VPGVHVVASTIVQSKLKVIAPDCAVPAVAVIPNASAAALTVFINMEALSMRFDFPNCVAVTVLIHAPLFA
jgi:hypothetical protein